PARAFIDSRCDCTSEVVQPSARARTALEEHRVTEPGRPAVPADPSTRGKRMIPAVKTRATTLRRTLLIASAALAVAPAAAQETVTYSYDARGRLVGVSHSGTVNNGV